MPIVIVPAAIDQATADARYVNVPGDVMSGTLQVNAPLALGAAPTNWDPAFGRVSLNGAATLAGSNQEFYLASNAVLEAGGTWRAAGDSVNYAGTILDVFNNVVLIQKTPSAAVGTAVTPVNMFRLDYSGLTIYDGAIYLNGSTGYAFQAGSITYSTVDGLRFVGKAGSSYDVSLSTPMNQPALVVPTGTRNAALPAGNLGLGAAPRTWDASYRVVDFNAGTNAIMGGNAGNIAMWFFANMYYDGAYRNTTNQATSMYCEFAGSHNWYTNASPGAAGTAFGPSLRMALNVKGHLGIGNSPHGSWGSAFAVLDLAAGKGAYTCDPSGYVQLSTNLYHDGTNWRNVADAPVTLFSHLVNGTFQWSCAVSPGVPGTTYTAPQRMLLDSSALYLTGNLLFSGVPYVGTNSTATLSLGANSTTYLTIDSAGATTLSRPNAHAVLILTATTGTNAATIRFNTTGGLGYVGQDDSTGAVFGQPYAMTIWAAASRNVELVPGATAAQRTTVNAGGTLTVRGGANVWGPTLIGSGATGSAFMNLGLVVDQASYTTEILALKAQGRLATGMTNYADTGTFFSMFRTSDLGGGAVLRGLCASGGVTSLLLQAFYGTTNIAHTTAGLGAVVVDAYRNNPPGVQAPVADQNVFIVASNSINAMIVDNEGDVYVNSSFVGTPFDDHDDAAMARALRASMRPAGDPLRMRFADLIARYREPLAAADIVAYNDGPGGDGVAFLNLKGAAMFTLDALWQMGERLRAQDERIARLERALGGAACPSD